MDIEAGGVWCWVLIPARRDCEPSRIVIGIRMTSCWEGSEHARFGENAVAVKQISLRHGARGTCGKEYADYGGRAAFVACGSSYSG